MNRDELARTAKVMVAKGKGILAADESIRTITKRFEGLGVESTADARRDYREVLFRAKDAMEKYISGVILYDETIRQTAKDGTPLIDLIKAAGAIPGIKVDGGAKPLANFPGETITEGLDGLRDRLNDYHRIGARFAKWRAVIHIGGGVPTDFAIEANARALAQYAGLCQESDIVPIVEPEVLMDGAHDLARCYQVTELVLKTVFMELYKARIFLEGMVLKPNMIVPGKSHPNKALPEEVAQATIRVLRNCAPAAVPGVAFLSGGQSDIEATANLDAISRLGGPWALTFSFGRALKDAPQRTWSGQLENMRAAQAAFAHRARMNGLAAQGRWSESEEGAGV